MGKIKFNSKFNSDPNPNQSYRRNITNISIFLFLLVYYFVNSGAKRVSHLSFRFLHDSELIEYLLFFFWIIVSLWADRDRGVSFFNFIWLYIIATIAITFLLFTSMKMFLFLSFSKSSVFVNCCVWNCY